MSIPVGCRVLRTRVSPARRIVLAAAGLLAVAGPGQSFAAQGDPPLPAQLAPAAVARVKQATVFLRVTTADGGKAEGSGFFTLKPGLLITNAHVLGMLGKQSKAPADVEVVLHSGQAKETTLKGTVVGVDRANDLGVVRVAGAGLPAPLPVETKRDLVETQKVYIFGFPFGTQLGKDITVSESSVSSLRNYGTDKVQQIQVNGGIHPGNSGGPVVNSDGKVVGVSVAVVRGTLINFAIPAHFVSDLATGRVADAQTGEAFKQDGKILLPVRFTCLDPLNQVKDMRLEVWAGPPGPALTASAQRPKTRPGDGPRQTVKLSYQEGVARADAALPAIPEGQVGWLQPVLLTADGKTHWGPSVATPANLLPLERKPAKLVANFTEVPERTVRLKSVTSMTLSRGKLSQVDADKLEVDLLEVVEVEPQHVYEKIGFGPTTKLVSEVDGRPVKMHPETPKMLRALPPNFIILTATGGLKSRVSRNVNPKLPIALRQDFAGCFSQLCTSLEAVMLPLPNRGMAPQGKFTTNIALLLGGPDVSGKQKGGQTVAKTIDLQLTCTYEGTRTRDEREEAVVTVAGQVKGRSKGTESAKGDVAGKFAVDLAGGFVSLAKLKITTEIEAPGGDVRLTYVVDVDLERQPGNPLNIKLPPERKAPKK
jgi:hypothetical protein